jgi:signal transduction histidine kinase
VSFITPDFKESPYMLRADIMMKGKHLGMVEVAYAEERPFLGEGPFLPEERNLINNVANEVALFHERRAAEEERALLQDQLRHADRLATIGQLAAGVAHELNEPLGNILGFAQLAQKTPGLMEQTSRDLTKIITASLHAREIIKKLMTFARQLPPRKTAADLNRIVDEGLYFFEARCAKSGIDLQRKLSPDLPEFTADPGQLNQVLVNLLVNAVHAMPEGGTLTVETRAENNKILLIVKDTGAGMDEAVKKQIFIPFFTTKDVNEGTGLGLPVVHGIVTSHKGTIKVKSKKGSGSQFEIRFPLTAPRKNKER